MKNKDAALRVALAFSLNPHVESVALAGSSAAGKSDENSDVDLYVYGEILPDDAFRAAVAKKFADPQTVQVGNRFWEPGDDWVDAQTGVEFDIMYRNTLWIEERIESVLGRCEPSLGYTTCLVRNVVCSEILYDRNGFLSALKERASVPYPEALRKAIIAHNHFVVRRLNTSYLHQLELAVLRKDRFGVLNRTDEILKSYFDILFALNRVYHPGEKRLLTYVRELCPLVPDRFETKFGHLMHSLGKPGDKTYEAANGLVCALEDLLESEGELP